MRFEIRRLHDKFKITTMHVTHDQSEAMVTSDRIVVMNKGRIEQIDAPHVLYGRPKSRFLGRCVGARGSGRGGRVALFAAPAGDRACHPKAQWRRAGGRAEIAGRSYLGEYWDYQARPLGAARPLRVSTGSNTVFEIGSRVWLEIDPAAMVRVA